MNEFAGTKILIAILIAFFMFGENEIYSLPQGEEVVEGTATFDRSAPDTLKITTSETAVINYDSFDINVNESVYFYQPLAASNALNNVLDGNTSYISGYLYANGNIYIVNPAGITFNPTSNIDVRGLVASTMPISNEDFMNSNFVFYKLDSETGQIINQGSITADGGFIALLSQAIKNEGLLKAQRGKVVLATGNKVTLSFEENNLIQVAIDEAVDSNPLQLDDAILNTGTIQADSGEVIIQASAVQGLFQNVVNNEGMIVANQIVEGEDGAIALISEEGDIRNKGTMYASGDITIDTPDTIEPGNITITGLGNIKIGEIHPPSKIEGTPHYTHKLADINITSVTEEDEVTTITTEHGDLLKYAIAGDVTLEAITGIIVNTTDLPLSGGTIKLIAPQIGSIEMPLMIDASHTHICKNIGDLDIATVIELGEEYVTITGTFGAVSYSSLSSLTLEAPLGGVTDSGQAIVPANTLTLIGKNIGHHGQPFITDAKLTHVIRTQGDIIIALHSIYGLYASLRGPPDDDFGITYNYSKSLFLEAEAGGITSVDGVVIYADTLSLSAYQDIGTSEIPLSIDATTLQDVTSHTGSVFISSYVQDLDVRGNIIASLGDISITSLRGNLDINATVEAPRGNILFKAEDGLIKTRGTMSADMETGTIVFKAAGLNIGGSYAAGYISFDPETDITISGPVDTSGATSYSTDGSIYVNNTVTVTSGNLTFTADNDTDSFGSFVQQGATTDITTAASGNITITSSGTATIYDIVSVGTLTINDNNFSNGNITLSGAISAADNITIQANNNLTIGGDVTITGASKTAILYADYYPTDGQGTLSKTAGTINVAATGTLKLQSGSNITTSDFLSGSTYMSFYIYTKGSANITIDESYDKSAVAGSYLQFYSNGNLTIDTSVHSLPIDLKAGTNGGVYLYADNDTDGTGTLSKTGGYTLTIDTASGSGTVRLQSTSDITVSDWVTASNFKSLSVFTTGSANITIDESYDKSTLSGSSLYFYSNGDLTIDTTVHSLPIDLKAGTNGSVWLYADYDEGGTGTLSKTGGYTLTIDTASGSGTIGIQSDSDITVSDWVTASNFKSLSVYTKGSANITINESYNKSTLSGSQLCFYSNGDLTIDTTDGNILLKAGASGWVWLYADYEANGTGTLSKTGGNTLTIDATTSGRITLQSASDITVSDFVTGSSNSQYLYVYTKGSANITIDESYDKSAISYSWLCFYSNGDLTIDTSVHSLPIDLKVGTGGWVYLYADYDEGGTGTLSKTGGYTLTIDTLSGSGSITLQSDSDITVSDWVTASNFKNLTVYTKGSANITIDASYDKSAAAGSYLQFCSNGDLTIDTSVHSLPIDLKAGTSGVVYLYADYEANGTGTLSKTGGYTLTIDTASGSGTVGLQSASNINVSNWVTASNFKSLYVYTKGSANITIDESYDKSTTSGSQLFFYSNGDLTIDTSVHSLPIDLKAGTNGRVCLYADYEANGTGTFSKTGGYTLTIDATTSGTVYLQSDSDITVSDWVTASNFKSLYVYTKGNANITIDESIDKSAAAGSYLQFYSNGDLTIDTSVHSLPIDLKASTNGWVYLYADYDEGGTGTLSKTGGFTLTIDATNSGTIGLQTAGDLTISDWLSDNAFKAYNASCTGTLTADMSMGTISDITLRGDYDENGVGDLTISGGVTIAGGTYSNITLEGANSFTISTLFTQVLRCGNGTFSLKSTAGSIAVDSAISSIEAVTLSAEDGITQSANIEVLGSTLTIEADNDADGTGALTASGGATLNCKYTSAMSITASGTSTLGGISRAGDLTFTAATSGAIFDASSSVTIYGDLTIESNATFDLNGNTLTLDTDSTFFNDGTLQLYGDETLTNFTNDTDSGTVAYTGNDNGGANTYTIKDFNTTDYYSLTINSADGTDDVFELGANLAMDGTLIVTQGVLYLKGKNISDAADGDTAVRGNIAGTIKLQGNESVFWTANDVDSGTYEYVGDGVADTYTIKDFGDNDYYHLTINSSLGAADTFQLDNTIDIDGNFTLTSGTFDVTTSDHQMNVAGNWSNSGAFTARSGTVIFDETGTSDISGSTAFYDFTSTQAGKTIQFDNTATQTVAGAFTLTGTAGSSTPIYLRSDVDGLQWSLNNSGTNDVSYVDVQDSDASGGNEIDAISNCTDSGNNLNWKFPAVGHPDYVKSEAYNTLSYLFKSYETEDKERKRKRARIRVTALIDTSRLILRNPYDFSISPYIM